MSLVIQPELTNHASIFRMSPKKGEIAEEEFPYHQAKDESMTMESTMTAASSGSSAGSTDDYEDSHPVSRALDDKSDMDGYRLEGAETQIPPSPANKLKDSIMQLKSKLNHIVQKSHEDAEAGYNNFDGAEEQQIHIDTSHKERFAQLGRRIQCELKKFTGKIKSFVKRLTKRGDVNESEAGNAVEAAVPVPEGFTQMD